MSVHSFFSEEEKKKIVDAIKEAELNTSGEIRLHVEGRCREEVLDHAAWVFEKLGMHKTELRNGVLFYLAVDDHQFAILGDAGINSRVSASFWDQITEEVILAFKSGKFAEGLAAGIRMAGQQLKEHFPYQNDDVNELPDEISFGDE